MEKGKFINNNYQKKGSNDSKALLKRKNQIELSIHISNHGRYGDVLFKKHLKQNK